MDKTLSIQLYTVRDKISTPEETAQTLKALASYGFTGVQTACITTEEAVNDFAKAAKAAGLKIIGTHINPDVLEDTEKAVRIHNTLGTTNAGIGGLPAIFRPDCTKELFLEGIERMMRIADKLYEKGFKFTYHHHSAEFARITPTETAMDIIVREFDPKKISFVLDTYWLNNGGVDVCEWIEKLAGRVDILHLKDKAVTLGQMDGHITELGAGNLNFKRILEVAEASGVQYLCYEQDNNFATDSLASAKQSAEYFYSIVK